MVFSKILAVVTPTEQMLLAAVAALSSVIVWMMRLFLTMRTDQQKREDGIHEQYKTAANDTRTNHNIELSKCSERLVANTKEYTTVLLEFARATMPTKKDKTDDNRGDRG